jgi:hypothetical protein
LIAILLAYVTVTAGLLVKIIDTKFEGVNTRLDTVDRDVQRLFAHAFDQQKDES